MENMDLDKVVQDYVLKNGSAMSEDRDVYYGWKDWEIESHQERDNCSGYVIDGKYIELIERSIGQFNGTFSKDNEEVGLELRGNMRCKCRKNKVKIVRLKGSFSDILLGILKDNQMISEVRVVGKYDDI